MRKLVLWSAAFSTIALVAVDARAQQAFVEGHVFNYRSLRPIANANVEISIGCAICTTQPRVVGYDFTDANGFYEVGVQTLREDLLPYDTVFVRVSCRTSESLFSGSATAVLRDETLRRDVYMRAPVDLVRCAPYQRQ